ncbi:hypothetical protein [Zemynaea arenosa]|uniref:hypothetical protein n=1 Tax=Zemynaea arenosa TaxID=2561931 RepID=UPI001432172A|nr:hypothetical protein [Massilia arenosa]
MLNLAGLLALTVSALVLCGPAGAADGKAVALVRAGLEAQGGEQRLRGIGSVVIEARGYRNLLEQSERPEGPFMVEFHTLNEVHEPAIRGLSRKLEVLFPPNASYATELLVKDGVAMRSMGERSMPGRAQDVQAAQETLSLAPERLLLTALDAPDLHAEQDVTLYTMPQHVVGFTLDGAPVRVYLSAATHLPTAVDYSGPLVRDGYAAFLGDVVRQTHFGFWRRDASGVRYPMQWDVLTTGLPDRTYMLRTLKLQQGSTLAQRAIPDGVVQAFRKAAAQTAPPPQPKDPVTLKPGIAMLAGAWYTAIVEQDDGLVILEAPISSDYSVAVLAQAAKLFPDKKVKAVVTTSDAWPHLAGIREYVARGIEVYALDRNAPILRRTIGASYASKPDALQRHPKPARMALVSDKTVIGRGANRIELYPVRGASAERQMVAWLPEHRLLYGSDVFQVTPDGKYSMPQTVDELVQAVDRERLDVDQVFLMHVGPMPFADLRKVPGSAD